MDCPACGNELTQVKADGVTIDVCQGGCGGLWFDAFELRRFDEPGEEEGQILLDIEKDASVRVDRARRYHCPACGDVVLMRHFWSPKREIEVDECPKCGGMWLDTGELGAIRAQFESEVDRRRAVDRFIDEEFGATFEHLRNRSGGGLAKARRIARMFRLLCPTYYIPGKQPWGAF